MTKVVSNTKNDLDVMRYDSSNYSKLRHVISKQVLLLYVLLLLGAKQRKDFATAREVRA
jgi:hypothetical protein